MDDIDGDPSTDTEAETAAVIPRPRRRRTPMWAALGVGVVALALVALLAEAPPATNVAGTSPLLGHSAPAVTGTSVLSGQATDLAANRGHFMLVNFFATWCIPCRQEHPEFVAFMQRHQAASDIGLVMVIFDDDPPKVRDWFHTHGGSWPTVADPSGAIALSYGVTGVPETYLVDPRGLVVAKIVGGVTAAGLDRLVGDAVAGHA